MCLPVTHALLPRLVPPSVGYSSYSMTSTLLAIEAGRRSMESFESLEVSKDVEASLPLGVYLV